MVSKSSDNINYIINVEKNKKFAYNILLGIHEGVR